MSGSQIQGVSPLLMAFGLIHKHFFPAPGAMWLYTWCQPLAVSLFLSWCSPRSLPYGSAMRRRETSRVHFRGQRARPGSRIVLSLCLLSRSLARSLVPPPTSPSRVLLLSRFPLHTNACYGITPPTVLYCLLRMKLVALKMYQSRHLKCSFLWHLRDLLVSVPWWIDECWTPRNPLPREH